MKTRLSTRLAYRWMRLRHAVRSAPHRFAIKHLPGLSLCHGVYGPCYRKGIRQRQNTAYTNDSLNWVTLCPECAQANAEHWADMWAEYYSGCR